MIKKIIYIDLILSKYKDESKSVKGKDLKDARRIMRSYGLILDVPKDLQKVISSLSDRIIIYGDKIRKYAKRKLFRRENAKFELYRGRFYRYLSDKAETTVDVPAEEIKNTWSKM
ncbi:hypothetical protein NAPIS_ORF02516 [Vairimorpha apis BRL 01]|uniref:Uncharacterized protein n=1 Tax=Vairimorpha apis BRL 01 TaxID=1037528 RepID=T0M920_9MICR|nr:hypothetical protein NAPIS_ORF02516 [Vairimorpha apis BRL 01]